MAFLKQNAAPVPEPATQPEVARVYKSTAHEAAVLAYKNKIETWRAAGQPIFVERPLTDIDKQALKYQLNATKRKESITLTQDLIKYLRDNEVATLKEITEDLWVTMPPVLKRLKIFRKYQLIALENKSYYIATPRFYEYAKEVLGK